ncbi:hypothetical protein CHLNCDRAFT_143513 [Chlorella variabilis]|uniref:Fungal lipase-type domain-containing protein n=1 Tax=Chlorella variabilis TaxID=554065 RepID=E1ZB31_CHLVA|nr:hypothetical protein CHLNCDRAFT_143513 [Chlorella variabilis]EFN56954.1 hypothetical protein CHLNCDRAFT_143513 [Chlorella variabilis]|eukprot:XP_005849056.1 hypothetical protein CHLNCDRAFT_143513 [Chlorella variabilis]
MRAGTRAALLGALLGLLVVGAAGATTAARQARLGADRAMRPGSPGSQEDARAAAALAWRAQFESPPPPPWWRRLWPWAAPTQRLIRVAPLEPHSGSLAAPAELRLPASQLEAELGAGLAPAVNAVDPRDDAFFSYNSSAMTPLVPLWLSWMTDLGRMANRSHGLDFSTAWRLSSYVAISYCNASSIATWNCSRCGGISAGFTPEAVVFDELWDLQGYVGYSAPLDAIVVAFRGTDSHSIYNWVQNMRTWRTDLALGYPGAPPHALVHGGFFTSYNGSALAANITAGVQALRGRHPDVPIYVSGHSLGAAMATLCALDLRLNLGAPDVRVYSFGSPRVGNQVFAEWFEEVVQVHWRFTHNRDIVPSVPPGYMGFYHVSREVWVVDLLFGHTLVGVCDASGEDQACHNSVCHLGLCSSLSDHLLYLSEMYSPHPMGC